MVLDGSDRLRESLGHSEVFPMTQKRSPGPHNSNSASGTEHLDVSEDRNLRAESPNKSSPKFPPNQKTEIENFENRKIKIEQFLGDPDLRFRSSETFKWSAPDAGLELWGPRERICVIENAPECPGIL